MVIVLQWEWAMWSVPGGMLVSEAQAGSDTHEIFCKKFLFHPSFTTLLLKSLWRLEHEDACQ